jgi:hypothetical protein
VSTIVELDAGAIAWELQQLVRAFLEVAHELPAKFPPERAFALGLAAGAVAQARAQWIQEHAPEETVQ